MDLGLAGKRAAVMAASQGLGRAAALALSREGARVAICARDAERLQQTAKEIEAETGHEVVPITADVSVADEVVRFVDEAASRLGGLDVLVKNSGGPGHGRFEDHGDAAWEHAFDLVAMSYVRGVRAALPYFREAGGGAVVAIESTSARTQIPNLLLSNAIRPVVLSTSKALADQYGPEGIRFNVVLPGSMDTARIRDLVRHEAEKTGVSFDEAMARKMSGTPLGRVGEPLELGDVIAFLASPRASYVTGTALAVDGGILRSVA